MDLQLLSTIISVLAAVVTVGISAASYLRLRGFTGGPSFPSWREWAFYAVPDWSNLHTLGQSRLLALTALVPFVGYLVLFNEQVVDLLLLSPSVIAGWFGLEPGTTSELTSKSFTLSRLQLTYFGLVFLGVASFLFTVSCPADVKAHPSVSTFIEHEAPLITNARTSLLVIEVSRKYLRHEPRANGKARLSDTLSYSDDLRLLFWTVVAEMARKTGVAVPTDKTQETGELGVITGTDEVNCDRVAELVVQRQRVFRVFWEAFDRVARTYTTDLLTLRYRGLVASRPYLRVIVSVCYLLGFAVLAYPTVQTFVLILLRVIGF